MKKLHVFILCAFDSSLVWTISGNTGCKDRRKSSIKGGAISRQSTPDWRQVDKVRAGRASEPSATPSLPWCYLPTEVVSYVSCIIWLPPQWALFFHNPHIGFGVRGPRRVGRFLYSIGHSAGLTKNTDGKRLQSEEFKDHNGWEGHVCIFYYEKGLRCQNSNRHTMDHNRSVKAQRGQESTALFEEQKLIFFWLISSSNAGFGPEWFHGD